MSTYSIRPITRSEIPQCVELIREGFLTVAMDFGFTKELSPKFTGFSISEDGLYWQFDVEKRPMFVYMQDSEAVGYYSMTNPQDWRVELNNLSVLPKYRHHGIGKTMVEHCCKLAREKGCEAVTVVIVEENRRLRKWYESLGFVHKGVTEAEGFEFHLGHLTKFI